MPQIENYEKEDPVNDRVVEQWEGFYDRLHVVILDDEGGYQVRRVVGEIEDMDAMDMVDNGDVVASPSDMSDRFGSIDTARQKAVRWMENNSYAVKGEIPDYAKESALSRKGKALITLEGYYESHIPFLINGEGHENGTPYRFTVDWVSEELFDREDREYEIASNLDMYVREGLVETLYADGTDIQSVEDYKDMKDQIEIMIDATKRDMVF